MERVQVRIRGRVDGDWSDWLGGMEIRGDDNGETVVAGVVRDQAALRGLIVRVTDMGIEIASVTSRKVDDGDGGGRM